MTRRPARTLVLLITVIALLATACQPVVPDLPFVGRSGGGTPYDVVVIGASSAGVGAAIGAAREGARVLLTEPTSRVGGMLTNGVTTDMLRQDASSGLFDEHRRLVRDAYRGHPDVALSSNGFNASPDVALTALNTLLAHPNIEIRTGVRLVSATSEDWLVRTATLADSRGTWTVQARTFIDGTAEGDLLAKVGVEGADWTVGREGQNVHGETLAPATGDRLQQAYTYRLTVQVGGRTDYKIPATYAEDRVRYAAIDRTPHPKGTCDLRQADGTVKRYTGLRIQRCLPDGKMDINADLFGVNHDYPTNEGSRPATEARLRGFVLGYLHWMRTEAGMPELGLPTDDYVDNGGFPTVLYVREGRRALGRDTFTQRDAAHDSTAPNRPQRSVAIGDYGLDSHCTGPAGGVAGGRTCEGGFWHGGRPYSIPFDIMATRRFPNLLVPAAVSASHVGYSTLRMEPVRMNIGYAAGIASVLAARARVHAADVDVPALQRNLVGRNQALVYLPGLPTSGPEFVAAQLAAVR